MEKRKINFQLNLDEAQLTPEKGSKLLIALISYDGEGETVAKPPLRSEVRLVKGSADYNIISHARAVSLSFPLPEYPLRVFSANQIIKQPV